VSQIPSYVAQQRARVAALSRHRAPDDVDLVCAQRDLRAVRLEQAILAAVAQAPPLTDQQKVRLAALLRSNGKAPGDAAGQVRPADA
jgi:hypothetical protein